MRSLTRFAGQTGHPAQLARTRLDLNLLDDRIVPANVLDLGSEGATASSDGVFFKQYDAQPTGTGHIDSFLRVQGSGSQGNPIQGYNTDARPLEFDENKSPNFTRGLPLSEVPTVTFGGGVYREFLLDINQKSSQPFLSLDELRLYMGDAGNLSGYDVATNSLTGAFQIYDLDATGDNYLMLDYRLNSGSGSGDMLMYVPDSLFSGGTHVYLFSRFGDHYASHVGFQEWAVGEGTLSEVTNIAGTVFHDFNQDMMRQADETRLDNYVVFIDTNGNEFRDNDEAWTITAQDGSFLFENVVVGESYMLWAEMDTTKGDFATFPMEAIPVLGTTVSVDLPIWRHMF